MKTLLYEAMLLKDTISFNLVSAQAPQDAESAREISVGVY